MKKQGYLKKGKKYTYDELKEIFDKAKEETLKSQEEDFGKVEKISGKENPTAKVMFHMQNMMTLIEFRQILFEEE